GSDREPVQARAGAQGQQQPAAGSWRHHGSYRQSHRCHPPVCPRLVPVRESAGVSHQWITVLGATGSIGVSTLDVVGRHPDRYRVFALTGHSRMDVLLNQCITHDPLYAGVCGASEGVRRQARLRRAGGEARVVDGGEALAEVSPDQRVDAVMAAIGGAAGRSPSLDAVRAARRVLLANKEALVMSGALFT